MKLNIAGKRVKAHRLKLKMAQIDLSEACKLKGLELHQADISNIENGKKWIKDFELVILACILETTPHKLLGYKKKDNTT